MPKQGKRKKEKLLSNDFCKHKKSCQVQVIIFFLLLERKQSQKQKFLPSAPIKDKLKYKKTCLHVVRQLLYGLWNALIKYIFSPVGLV